jgi:hypothetical protein
MPDAPRQLRTDLPGAGPFRAVLWHQDALDEGPFPPEEWLSPEERASLPPTIDVTCHMCGRTFSVRTS